VEILSFVDHTAFAPSKVGGGGGGGPEGLFPLVINEIEFENWNAIILYWYYFVCVKPFYYGLYSKMLSYSEEVVAKCI
jgi:hypothetical protein